MLYSPLSPDERLGRLESTSEDFETSLRRIRSELKEQQEQLASLKDRLAKADEKRGLRGASWYPAGAVLAGLLSWWRNSSLLWAILHGLLSWLYVGYRLVQHLLSG